MIRLNCTHCKAQLSIDDAFAGGVCRCQYCGTIQTVPKRLQASPEGSGSVALGSSGRMSAAKAGDLRKPRGDAGGSSGLDALANAVAGSGLAAAAGRHKSAAPVTRLPAKPTKPSVPQALPAAPEPAPVPPPSRAGLPIVLIVLALVILLLLGIIVGLLLKNRAAG